MNKSMSGIRMIECPTCRGRDNWCDACYGLGQIPIGEPREKHWLRNWLITLAVGVALWFVIIKLLLRAM